VGCLHPRVQNQVHKALNAAACFETRLVLRTTSPLLLVGHQRSAMQVLKWCKPLLMGLVATGVVQMGGCYSLCHTAAASALHRAWGQQKLVHTWCWKLLLSTAQALCQGCL
jgi:hypothetical protein